VYNSSVNFYFEWNLNFSFLIYTCDFPETVIKDNLFSVNADDACTYSLYHTYKCMTLMINYEIIIKLTIVSLLCLTMALCSIGGWSHRLSLIKLIYYSLLLPMMTSSEVTWPEVTPFPALFSYYSSSTKCPIAVCHSIYGFWLFLWYLLVIMLFVIRLTASDYSFSFSCKGTFCSTTIVRKKHGKNDVTSCDVTSGHATSGHVNNVTFGHVASGDVIIGKSRLL
jgi:hypothetical protein